MVKDKHIQIEALNDFNLQHIFECGQSFRYLKESQNDYWIVAFGKVIRLIQEENSLKVYHTTEEEWKKLWFDYFDLGRDYGSIKATISKDDSHLKEAIKQKWGVRLLNQEPLETLISFIISQNKNIPHIMSILELISKEYGDLIFDDGNRSFYCFPSLSVLKTLTIEDFRRLKCGFRAPYLVDAIQRIANEPDYFKQIQQIPTGEAKQKLMEIHGVGEKVAECTLLFGCGRHELYPVDVWVKRLTEDLYLQKDTNNAVIRSFAKQKWGELAGYAQQYLFYAYRDRNKGKG